MISRPPRLVFSVPKEMSAFPSLLRPRGLADHCEKRARFPIDGDPFSHCNLCETALKGCLKKAHGNGDTYLLTCGHVVCKSCVTNMRMQSQVPRAAPNVELVKTHFRCPECRILVTDILLPSPTSANLPTCAISFCKGESFSVSNLRCKNCCRDICDECQEVHSIQFPQHELAKRNLDVMHVPLDRHFTGCKHHGYRPLEGRCKCGEMVCDQCLTAYTTYYDHGMECTRIRHDKERLDEANLDLEESLFDSLSLSSKLKSMLQLTQQKQDDLAEKVDRMNNEIACHFNQIILQAINRCWETMRYVKMQTGIHYKRLKKHQLDLERVERQIKIGLELDERGRDRRHVKPESVSQLIRHFSYSLTEPAVEELTKLEDFQSKIEMFEPVIMLHYETRDILNLIRHWGMEIQTNVRSLRQELEMVHQPPSELVKMVNVDGEMIHNICLDGMMDSSEIPIRVHMALDHFEDLYQKRFGKPPVCKKDGLIVTYEKAERAFSLGLRLPEEAHMSEKELQDRRAYDISVRAKPGVMLMAPKVIGGMKRVFNLRELTLTPKEVCTVFKRTVTPGPIWYPDGGTSESVQQNKQTGASGIITKPKPNAGTLHQQPIMPQLEPEDGRPPPLRFAKSPVKEDEVEEKPPVENGTHRIREESVEVLEDGTDFNLPSTSTQIAPAPGEVIDNRHRNDAAPTEAAPSKRYVIREVMADAYKEHRERLVKQTQNKLAMENTMHKIHVMGREHGWCGALKMAGIVHPLVLKRASERPPQPTDSPIVIPRGLTFNRTNKPSMQISKERLAEIQKGKIPVMMPIPRQPLKPYKLLEDDNRHSDGCARTSIEVIYPIKDKDGNIINQKSTDGRTLISDLVHLSHPTVGTSRDGDGPPTLFGKFGATEAPVKSEEDTGGWKELSTHERSRLEAAGITKDIMASEIPEYDGCFVCDIICSNFNRGPNWQCDMCKRSGRRPPSNDERNARLAAHPIAPAPPVYYPCAPPRRGRPPKVPKSPPSPPRPRGRPRKIPARYRDDEDTARTSNSKAITDDDSSSPSPSGWTKETSESEPEARSPSPLMARSAMDADKIKIEEPDDPEESGPSAPKRSRKQNLRGVR